MVEINYFTKWVEAESLANIRDIDAKKNLFKRILLLDLGSLIPSSRTMCFSLIVKLSGDITVNWALGIDIQPQPICNGMGKLKQSTKS